MLKKIVIIGPESTGKSTLSQQLATYYNTRWCPEYAREYLLKHGASYSYDDLLTIAQGQVTLEEKHIEEVRKTISGTQTSSSGLPGLPASPLLFIDTDMYVMKVWSEFVFGKCHPYIMEQVNERKYDLYLLCNTDLPWIKDEFREYPDLESRLRLFGIYKEIMMNQSVPWAEISGSNEERLRKGIEATDRLLKG